MRDFNAQSSTPPGVCGDRVCVTCGAARPIIDSGASCHRCCKPSRFHPFHCVPATIINMPTLESGHGRKGAERDINATSLFM